MSICSRCGGDIDFRYVDGRCIPIHLSGGCGGAASYSPVKDYSAFTESHDAILFMLTLLLPLQFDPASSSCVDSSKME